VTDVTATWPWRPPDWREAAAYPTRASPYRWASEFLIRNAEFRGQWHEACEAIERTPGPRTRQAALELLHHWGVAGPVLKAWRDRTALDSPFIFEIPPYSLGTRWRLAKDAHHLVAFAFDVRVSLEAQIARAKSALLAYRRGYRSSREAAALGAQRQRADYALLLRVLDARDAHVPFAAIAATLFPRQAGGADRVRKLYARACALRDGGYRDVALLGWTGRERKRTR
jgi:hypothetical protein